jgi:predicted site-specific integrase-resolvase
MIAIEKAAAQIGVAKVTLRRWEKKGLITPKRTPGNHRRYSIKMLQEVMQKNYRGKKEEHLEKMNSAENRPKKENVAVYARVSQPIQKVHGDLQRQIERLERHAEENNKKLVKCYKDVASGLNAKRRGLWKMMHDAAKGKFSELLVTFPDRLSRFGVEFIEQYLKIFEIEVTYIISTRSPRGQR